MMTATFIGTKEYAKVRRTWSRRTRHSIYPVDYERYRVCASELDHARSRLTQWPDALMYEDRSIE